jgi:hypothetical protein
VGAQRPAGRLLDIEGLERDGADLALSRFLTERGILQDAEHAIRMSAELIGGGARGGRIDERGEQEQGRGERGDQAMTLIRA